MTRSGRSIERDSQQRAASGHRSGGSRRSGAPADRPGASAKAEFAPPVSTTPALPAVDAFGALDLPPALLDVLTRQGLTAPFPIQASTLPDALAGRDVLGRSPDPVIDRPRHTGSTGRGRPGRPTPARRAAQANPASRTRRPGRARAAA